MPTKDLSVLYKLGHFLIRLDGRIGRACCRWRGHVYDFSSTDIVGMGPDPFAPAVWCGRCHLYVPDPRGDTVECEKCSGTGARHVAGEPVVSEACGECSGEGVVST